MSEENETITPPWIATQTPKVDAPKVDPTADTEPPVSTEKRSRRPRRTKAQMLADAAARPDALRGTAAGIDAAESAVAFDGEGGVSIVKDRLGTKRVECIAPTMAAEDTMRAHARDFSRHSEPTWGDLIARHGPLAIAVLALITAVSAHFR